MMTEKKVHLSRTACVLVILFAVTVSGCNESQDSMDIVSLIEQNQREVQALPFVDISMEAYSTTILSANGDVWSWGMNSDGALGNGTLDNSSEPVKVILDTPASAVETGLALDLDGGLWIWGPVAALQGITGEQQTFPSQLDFFDTIQIDQAGSHIFLKTDGTVWIYGSLFVNSSPTEILTSQDLLDEVQGFGEDVTVGYYIDIPFQVPGLSRIVDISVGADHASALDETGSVWLWGEMPPQASSDAIQPTPERLSDFDRVVDVESGIRNTILLREDGTVWTVETRDLGVIRRIRPLTNIIAISAKYKHYLALRADGTVWAWGYNNDGQIGDGTSTDRNRPVEVIGLDDVILIETGYFTSAAFRSDGSVWTWGYNEFGQLGDGTTIDRTSPVQVIGLDTTLD